jgi:outer membrane protein assembly factor BamB
VVGFDDGKLVAVSPVRGNVLWTTTVAAPKGRSELERMVDIDGEFAVVEGIIYVAGFRGRIAAVTLSEGQALWSRELSSHMGLEVDAERVYVTDTSSHVWALDRTTGATLWKQDKLEHRELTAPVAAGDSVLVGDFEGYVHWLSKDDGRLLARSRPGAAGILSTPIVTRETAYVLDRGGRIAALQLPASARKTPAFEEDRSMQDEGLQSLELEPFPQEGWRSRQ